MFKTRLLSGIMLVIIALATIIPGGTILWGALLLISLKGMHELYQIGGVQNKMPGIVGMLAAVMYYYFLYFYYGVEDWFAMIMIGALIILMAVYVFTFPRYRAEQIMVVYFGIFYPESNEQCKNSGYDNTIPCDVKRPNRNGYQQSHCLNT